MSFSALWGLFLCIFLLWKRENDIWPIFATFLFWPLIQFGRWKYSKYNSQLTCLNITFSKQCFITGVKPRFIYRSVFTGDNLFQEESVFLAIVVLPLYHLRHETICCSLHKLWQRKSNVTTFKLNITHHVGIIVWILTTSFSWLLWVFILLDSKVSNSMWLLRCVVIVSSD